MTRRRFCSRATLGVCDSKFCSSIPDLLLDTTVSFARWFSCVYLSLFVSYLHSFSWRTCRLSVDSLLCLRTTLVFAFSMAPEVARGERYNLKADVYSFSVLLYEVLNLEKAYSGLDPQEIIERIHYKKQRPRISLFWPPAMRNLLKSTWSDIPSARLPMKHVQAILVKEIEDLNEAANIDD